MLWFILAAIIFTIVVVIVYMNEWTDLGEKIGFSVMLAITFFLAALIISLIGGAILSCDDDNVTYTKTEDIKIIALKDNQNVSGSFYIFGGYVDENLYYYYATETELGYKTEKLKAENAYIKYTNETPRIETYKVEFVRDSLNWFGIPLGKDRHIIYCPENTITTEFNIDLE